VNTLVHKFVDQVPVDLENGVVYVSIPFSTVIHKCWCGCGHEVVTPLSRKTGWQLIFDGESISLHPSVGNRALPCRSHYWIEGNTVVWAGWRDEPSTKRGKRRGANARSGALVEEDWADNASRSEQSAQSERTYGARLRRWLQR
jgi:Family of unknown function (DUF6527)